MWLGIAMSWMNDKATQLCAGEILSSLAERDVPSDMLEALKSGWAVRDGAVVLVNWHDNYFGRRLPRQTVRAFEASVNGRAISDMDLFDQGDVRRILLRRGLAFGWVALRQQILDLPDVKMVSEISIAPILSEPDSWTGNVTFYRSGTRYDPRGEQQDDDDPEIVVRLATGECCTPLRSDRDSV